jgi:lipid-binding SYLF domain-containing protein
MSFAFAIVVDDDSKMKTTMFGLVLLSLAFSARAIEKVELDNRIRVLTGKFEALQQKPDKKIPAEVLGKAQGIILLDRTKAGFLFAYQGGGGVAMVKDPKTHRWSPAAFMSANEASLGFQVGGEQAFFVILLMDTNATRLLTEPAFELGSEARGTAGNTSGGVERALPTGQPPVLVYGDRQGLYGGASVKAGAVSPDDRANIIYYGQTLSMADILFGNKVKPTEAAVDLAGKLTEYSRDRPR